MATVRIELGGVQVLDRAPAVRVEVAGLQLLDRCPRVRGELAGVNVLCAGFGMLISVSGSITAQSSVSGRLQIRLPAHEPVLSEPYPTPMYRGTDTAMDECFLDWQCWWDRHLRQVMKELFNLGERKAGEWVDV